MAILVVPDVHGRLFWRRPVETYIERVNRVVFLGDYLDPYPVETEGRAEDVYHNLMDIIRLKQTYPEKVVLLKEIMMSTIVRCFFTNLPAAHVATMNTGNSTTNYSGIMLYFFS